MFVFGGVSAARFVGGAQHAKGAMPARRDRIMRQNLAHVKC